MSLIEEIRMQQQIHPLFPDELIEQYIEEGKQDIDNACGAEIDYDEDLEARSLLKMYVLFARHQIIDEFKVRYANEYVKLQIKYY